MYKSIIAFVRPGEDDAELASVKTEVVCTSPQNSAETLTGDEAKSFYDELVGLSFGSTDEYPSAVSLDENPQQTPQSLKDEVSVAVDSSDEEMEEILSGKAHKRKECKNLFDCDPSGSNRGSRTTKVPTAKELLSSAQNGHLKDLRRILLTKALDVNLQDAYGWSALHCAAYEGHVGCVLILLKFGANRDLKDNRGRRASDLARRRKKHRVYRAIQDFGKEKTCHNDEAKVEPVVAEIIRCTECNADFDSRARETHEKSVVHLAALSAAKQAPHGYVIPEANVGFRMLEQMGWNRETGLGSDGQGRKFPVKTQLKQDREGLGLTAKPMRVSHFNPGDVRAIQRSENREKRKKVSKLSTESHGSQKKPKRNGPHTAFERDFRRAFY